MERSKVLTALAALAHETRLDLVRMLMPHGDAGMAAGHLAQALGLAAPRLSFHLSALEQAGLIRSRRAARNVIYSVDAHGIGQTIAYLLNDCCMDHPEVLAACAHGSGPHPRAPDQVQPPFQPPFQPPSQPPSPSGIAKT